jgi:outer membrane biosynthesis protein TonB
MTKLRGFALAGCLGLLAVAFLPSSKADEWDKKTILTVNEPLVIPGKVLQPGKYVMKLMESPADRYIVQIFNADESHLEATVLAIPNYRLQPTDKTQFAFWEMPAGEPHALKAWFYPGDNYGRQFAYPKDMAATIAKNNNQNVPTAAQTDNTKSEITQTPPAGEAQQQAAAEPQPAPTQPAEPTQTAAAQPAPAPEPAPANPPAATENNAAPAPAPAETTPPAANLPRTASSMPLVGLAGLFAFGFALIARTLARQIS